MVDFSTHKNGKMADLLDLGSFDFEKELFWLWWPSDSIDKVLMEFYVNFLKNQLEIPDPQKYGGLLQTIIRILGDFLVLSVFWHLKWVSFRP